mgnify:CR=1 FL=1
MPRNEAYIRSLPEFERIEQTVSNSSILYLRSYPYSPYVVSSFLYPLRFYYLLTSFTSSSYFLVFPFLLSLPFSLIPQSDFLFFSLYREA